MSWKDIPCEKWLSSTHDQSLSKVIRSQSTLCCGIRMETQYFPVGIIDLLATLGKNLNRAMF